MNTLSSRLEQLKSDFDRDGPPDEGLTQISYRGWWLYIYPTAASQTQNVVPKLFELVSPDITPLQSLKVSDDDVGGFPGVLGGP